MAPDWSRGSPLLATITGSTTRASLEGEFAKVLSRISATALMTSLEWSSPVLTAAMGKDWKRRRICSATISGGMGWMALTLPGTSATTQVMAVTA